MFERPKHASATEITPRCVDGGYTPEQVIKFNEDSFARAGADGGYVEALLKIAKDNSVDLSGHDAVELIADIVRGFGRQFFNHTDMHAEHANHENHADDSKIGCGHEAKAVEFSEEYGVDARDMQDAINTIVHNEFSSINVALDREHTEDAVLVVKGDRYSVRPWNKDKTAMNFIYDVDIDGEVMQAIWAEIQKRKEFASVPLAEFKAAADLQTGLTVDKLATSKGKPTFVVTFDEAGKPTVSE